MSGFLDKPANRKRLQQALHDHLDPAGVPYYSGKIDGDLGRLSITAMSRFRADKQLDHPGEPVFDADMERELGLLTIQDPIVVGIAKTKGIDLLALIGLIGSIRAFMKGLKMDSTTVDVKSAWLSSKNWAAGIAILTNVAAIFHIVIPPDLAPTVQAVVTSAAALYVIVKNTWFTTTVTTASAKKL